MKFKGKDIDWQAVTTNGKKAKESLMGLVTPQGKVGFVQLENGNQIPVNKVTEEQAMEFFKEIMPSWDKS